MKFKNRVVFELHLSQKHKSFIFSWKQLLTKKIKKKNNKKKLKKKKIKKKLKKKN